MEEKVTKICPMRPIYSENKETGEVTFYKCEEEHCGWWCKATKMCAVLALKEAFIRRK